MALLASSRVCGSTLFAVKDFRVDIAAPNYSCLLCSDQRYPKWIEGQMFSSVFEEHTYRRYPEDTEQRQLSEWG